MTSMGFNWIDYIFIAGLVVFALLGVKRGFVKSLMTLVVWLAAFLFATLFKNELAGFFMKVTPNPSYQSSFSFASIFIVVLIIGALVNYLLSSMVDKKGLGLLDRAAGLIFGLFCGILIFTFLVYLLTFTPVRQYSDWQNATLVSGFSQIASTIKTKVPMAQLPLNTKSDQAVPANEQDHLNTTQGDHVNDQT